MNIDEVVEKIARMLSDSKCHEMKQKLYSTTVVYTKEEQNALDSLVEIKKSRIDYRSKRAADSAVYTLLYNEAKRLYNDDYQGYMDETV